MMVNSWPAAVTRREPHGSRQMVNRGDVSWVGPRLESEPEHDVADGSGDEHQRERQEYSTYRRSGFTSVIIHPSGGTHSG